MDTNGHELFNHENHERHEKKAGGESRNHEWTRMDTNYLTTKTTKYTKKSRGDSKNHEWTRMDKIRG